MKFSSTELLDLTMPCGGRFCISSLHEAYAFCEHLARKHYENFPVGSLLLPRTLRRHFYAVYAFARIADDIADELHAHESIKHHALNTFETLLCTPEHVYGHPIFTALHATMQEKALPILPFHKLLHAFRMDASFCQASSWEELEYYCAHSANPIGELVLRLFDAYTPQRAALSDAICTGLQLTNFWQDLSRDIPRGRLFIPHTVLATCGIEASELYNLYTPSSLLPNDAALELVKERFFHCFTLLFQRTKSYFTRGIALLPVLPSSRLRAEIALTIAGGERILEQAFRLQQHIFYKRPQLVCTDVPLLLVRSLRHYIWHTT
ncbi:MAG: squalene/phytoene synthase family protein [Bacteroidota bacterium]|nr:squalene/phytoene synthase family protein [Candidatus Kapabacteria bacterium]MDW8219876.1 squalene/phytoene synthase family protein [Bacteroidota bacterium]